MKTIPFFENDILATMFRNFKNNFSFEYWFYIFIGVLLFLYLIYCLLTKIGKNKVVYNNLFSNEIYLFDKHNKKNWLYISFPALALALLAVCMYSLDVSLFNNYDLMSIGTTGVFNIGVLPSMLLNSRFQPTSFFEMNIIYAITHNYNIVNIYLLLQTTFIGYLLYILLNFIPVNKRLVLIACCFFCPAFFWVNNAIFCEMTILIYILLSFLAIKKFSVTGKNKYLWFFIFFMNWAIYAKETVILLYFGILACSVFYNIFMENIKLSSFIHPFKTMKRMPLETLLMSSMLIYCLTFLLMSSGINGNDYIEYRVSNITNMLIFYKFEIIVTAIATIMALIKIFKGKIDYNPCLREGVVLGCLTTVLIIIFKLKIMPQLWHVEMKTYYMIIPAIFAMIYIIDGIKNKVILRLLFVVTIGYMVVTNYKIYQNEQGIYYHDVAKFMSNNIIKEDETKIFITENTEETVWSMTTWSTSYKYFFPQEKIIIKYPNFYEDHIFFLLLSGKTKMYTPIERASSPETGDYLILRKTPAIDIDMERIKNMKYEKIYENKIFEIYKIL